MTAVPQQTGVPGHAAPHRDLVPIGVLWFALFGAPAAWAAQLISNYALMSHFCYPTDTPLAAPTFGGVRVLSIVLDVVLLLVAVAALASAIGAWVRTRHETRVLKGPEHEEAAEIGEGRTRFMAMSGILVSGIFVYGIIMAGLPLITMPICVF